MKTLDKVLKLKTKISKLVDEIIALQDACPHDNVVKIARSDTGNYCRADDSYWYEMDCPDCLKFWREEQ